MTGVRIADVQRIARLRFLLESDTTPNHGCATLSSNGRNAEILACFKEHPEIKERIEVKIRNVPEQSCERAFINAAKTEAMNQTVQRRNRSGVLA